MQFDQEAKRSVDHILLADMHEEAAKSVSRALERLLSSKSARLILSQVVDGKPTLESCRRNRINENFLPGIEDHLCPSEEATAQIRRLVTTFETSNLPIRAHAAQAFQDSSPGSAQAKIRFFEVVTAAFHDIVARLYNELFPSSRPPSNPLPVRKRKLWRGAYVRKPDPLLQHFCYYHCGRYPQWKGDVAAYWAESELLGGVALLERTEVGEEALSAWLHPPDTHSSFRLSDAQLEEFYRLGDDTNASPRPQRDTIDDIDFLPFQFSSQVESADTQQRWDRYIYQHRTDRWLPRITRRYLTDPAVEVAKAEEAYEQFKKKQRQEKEEQGQKKGTGKQQKHEGAGSESFEDGVG